MRTRLLALTTALGVFAAVPAAHATLVFDKGFGTTVRPSIYVANDDGTGARKLASRGELPRVSADGQTVVYETLYTTKPPKLMTVPAAGGTPRVLVNPVWSFGNFAWSPDSKTVATLTGSEIHAKTLVLIDVATGQARTVVKGFFYGISFSPAGDMVAFAVSQSDNSYPPKVDVFVAPTAGGAPVSLTTDHKSMAPVWGPTSIVFAKMRKPPAGPRQKMDAWKQDLYLMNPDGSNTRRLTTTHPAFLTSGLAPADWSADGTRLLANFGGQDTNYAETVNPSSGRVLVVGRVRDGIVGWRLSHDGKSILATTGGFDPGSASHNVVSIPYGGGPAKVLARNAFNADWNR